MTVLAKDLYERVRRVLLDENSVRWTLAELTTWTNDGMREVALQKPNACSRNIILALVAGTRQTLPAAYLAFLRIIRNLKTGDEPRQGDRAVRVVSREIMDTQLPGWHDPDVNPAAKVVKAYVFDELDPRTLYVHPPNDASGFLEVVASKVPDPVVATGNVEDMASYDVALDIDDIYFNALLDYVLFRNFSKEADFAGNAGRAAAHYQLFANSLGIKVNVEALTSPNMKPRVVTA